MKDSIDGFTKWEMSVAESYRQSSAQPDPCENAVNRKAAVDHFRSIIEATDTKERYNEGFVDGLEFCISHLSTMPSAQPEVIHCKDCKHRIEHKHYGDLGESAYTCEGNMIGWILPDDFCSNAERRTDETD